MKMKEVFAPQIQGITKEMRTDARRSGGESWHIRADRIQMGAGIAVPGYLSFAENRGSFQMFHRLVVPYRFGMERGASERV